MQRLEFSGAVRPLYVSLGVQEANTLELWHKLHFEEKNTESIYHV